MTWYFKAYNIVHMVTGNGHQIESAWKCMGFHKLVSCCTLGISSILLPVSSPYQEYVESQHYSQTEASVDSMEVMEDVVEGNELSEGSNWHGEESCGVCVLGGGGEL